MVHCPSALTNRSRGFTAVELLFTVTITGIVLALAVPSFRDFLQNSRAAEEANALAGALALARSEAITRGLPVTVCSTTNNTSCANSTTWGTGWIVFTDANTPIGAVNTGATPDTVIRALPALPTGSTLTADANFVSYASSGFLGSAAAVNFTLAIQGCTGLNNRTIAVNLQGRAAITRTTCL